MRRVALIYLVLLALSTLWVAVSSRIAEEPVYSGSSVDVLEFSDDRRGERRVRLAYTTLGDVRKEAVLLLHGSPGSLQDFAALGEQLASDRFIVVPNMLGFGDSERGVADHSFVAQADALIQLIDSLGIDRVHVVGFSWGGGVAIELASRIPSRTASIVMVSAIGVQELELLGHFTLNRLVHRMQHALIVAIDWLIPHFGVLNRSPLSRGFSRSFLDSDQRPLREKLGEWRGPMLIVHGEDDFLVPAAAAKEHARIVPQSRSVWIAGGHLVLWSHTQEVVAALTTWLSDWDRGELANRSDAMPERVAAAESAFDGGLAGPQTGIGWMVFALLVFAASMVSEDLACAGVGLLVAAGQIGFLGGVIACIFALVVGDLVLYLGGRWIGSPLLDRVKDGPFDLSSLHDRLNRSVGRVVLLGRFIPGARLPTYVAAGALRSAFIPFTFFLIVAASLWAPLLVGVSAVGGRALALHSETLGSALWPGVALIGTIAVCARIVPQLLNERGRRLLLARWRRLRRWEFWPIWAIYLPLVPSIARMALKHGSLRIVTLVNPPIPGGGLAGESKADLDAVLSRVPELTTPTAIIAPGSEGDRLQQIEDFMRAESLTFPIVLKPDVGDRGHAVEIIHAETAIQPYLDRYPGRSLVQAFVPGQEFGLFFCRLPDEPEGRLFSIARKSPRTVIGNGHDSLEHLILRDPICLPMAHKLLIENAARLDDVPDCDVRVRVSELGTHSLGCRFLIGEDLRTEALTDSVERLSRAANLDFGRYDVLSPDEESLRRGIFKVIEFNGLTGEAAHCYDPQYDLFAGLKILREQWRIAFEIGAAHRAAGREPLSFRALGRLVRDSQA